MKKIAKKWLVISFLALTFFLILKPELSQAYAGGLLDGKTLKVGNQSFVQHTTTVVLTDNIINAISKFDLNDTTRTTFWYEFPSEVSVSSVQMLADGNPSLTVIFYDGAGATIGQDQFTANGVLKSFGTVSGVRKFSVTTNTMTVYEFNLFSNSDTTPPPVPTGLTATPGIDEANLSWSAVSAPDLIGYNVYQSSEKITSTPITSTTLKVMGLTGGTTYSFSVSSVDQTGNESAKSAFVTVTPQSVNTTPPPVPTGLTGTPTGSQGIDLSWTAVSDPDLEGYHVYRNGTKLTSSPIGATSYSVTGLTSGTYYTFQVTAVGTNGLESSKSTPFTYTEPDSLTVNFVPNGTSIIVQITGGTAPFVIDWGSGTDTTNQKQYTITGLTKDTDYTVTVTDSNSKTFTDTINTGNKVGFVPPPLPDPTSLFQRMLDGFGDSGKIAIAIIGGAVLLGVMVVLAMFGWRLTRRWISAVK